MQPLEKELHEIVRDQRLLDFFEKAVSGLWLWDLTKDGVSYVTAAFADLVGYKLGEFEQGTAFWQSISHPDDWDESMVAIHDAIATKSVYDHTCRIRHKKGHWKWVRSVGLMMFDEHGEPHRGFGIAHDLTEFMESKLRLEKESTHDPLTNLLNRRGIEQALEHIAYQVRRYECHAYGVVLDVDNFKMINDAYGHSAGDTVLLETAKRITRTVRVVDYCGRLGGDEFLVFLLARDRAEAEHVADRLRSSIEQNAIELFQGKEVRVTVSSALLPVYSGDNAHYTKLDQFLYAASPYLQKSKQEGKNIISSPNQQSPIAD